MHGVIMILKDTATFQVLFIIIIYDWLSSSDIDADTGGLLIHAQEPNRALGISDLDLRPFALTPPPLAEPSQISRATIAAVYKIS